MRNRLTLADISPKLLTPAVLEELRPRGVAAQQLAAAMPADNRVRQSRKKSSALEDRWGVQLAARYPGAKIYPQFPLPIANGSNYYVDFLIVLGNRGALEVHAHEVKGPYARTAGTVKLKVAARIHPWARFQMVSFKDGRWVEQEILP